MAHLPPNAAIFSPSVARAAASAAKEWSYIDAWLQRKFPGRGPPPFERNPDTLRALLALASANEAADEERALIARLEAETLSQLRAHEHAQDQPQPSHPDDTATTPPPPTLHSAREAILASLEASLTRDGQTALTSLAALALQTNTPLPTPSALGATLHALTTETLTLSQTLARTHTLSTYLTHEAAQTTALSTSLQQPNPHDDDDHNPSTADPPPAGGAAGGGATGYHPPPNLSLQNLTTQRRIKSLSARLPELRDKAASLARSTPYNNNNTTKGSSSSSSIPHLLQEEAAYLALQSIKRDLETQLHAFAGLPPDVELARQELEGVREELRGLVARREEVFEGLVERETPRKGSRGGVGRR